MNEFERFQFETLKSYVLEKGWFEKLILQLNLNEEQSDKLTDICNHHDNLPKSNIKYSDFEHDVKTDLGIGYQSVKIILLAMHKNQVYSDLVYGSIDSIRENTDTTGYMPSEFKSIERDLFGNNKG